MRAVCLAFAAVALWVSAAAAQVGIPWPGPGNPHSAGSSFVGIGDVQSGWVGYWGVVPYNTAYAVAHGNAFDFSCTGPGTGTVPFLTTGFLDLTGGISGCSGTISITKLYDQTGATYCNALTLACNLDSITSGTIVFLQSGCPSTSVITYCISTSSLNMATSNHIGSPQTITQPMVVTLVANRPTAARGSTQRMFAETSGNPSFGASATNDLWFMYGGDGEQTFSAADGVTHTAQLLLNGASSTYTIDTGTTTTTTGSPGATFFSDTTKMAIGVAGGFGTTGIIYQVGIHTSTLSSGVQANVAHNQCVNVGTSAAPTC